jgi:hypothetical protein
VCDPPGQSTRCTPGCTDEWHTWCTMDKVRNTNDVWCDGDPWKPTELSTMIAGYTRRESGKLAERGATAFNEFILDAEYSESQLPGSIEAFFYLLDDMCLTNSRCKPMAERAHAKFLREYRLNAEEVPLLGLRMDDWKHPFVVVPPNQLTVENEY